MFEMKMFRFWAGGLLRAGWLPLLAGALATGCTAGRPPAKVEVSGPRMPLAELSVERSFFVDRSMDSPFGAAAHARLCARVEKELVRRGWRPENRERAVFRVACRWTDVEWQRVNRAARAPMTRLWYLGGVYDPQGESYEVPGKTGKFRPRQSTLSLVIDYNPLNRGSSALGGAVSTWSAARAQTGGEAGDESIARLVSVLVE
jgi:hypothetical protein